jgi:nicotinamidase-related amidase
MPVTALLLIDIQNEYFPGGKNPLEAPEAAAAQARRLLEHFRQAGLPLLHIQHVANRLGATTFLPGTPGVEIHPAVAPLPGESVIQKHYPNSFRQTPLLERLQSLGVERLLICGMMTHMCVHAAGRAAADLGFEVIVAHDACATRPLTFNGQDVPAAQVQAAFLAALSGYYGQVLSVDEALARLA